MSIARWATGAALALVAVAGVTGLGLGLYGQARLDRLQRALDEAMAPQGGWRLETTMALNRHGELLDEHAMALRRIEACACTPGATAKVAR